jgi:mono/diheme cytochrome c family protein
VTRTASTVIALWSSIALLGCAVAGSPDPSTEGGALQPGATASKDAVPAAEDGEMFTQRMAEGAQLFAKLCAPCHGADGGGMVGPPLRQLADNVRGLVRIIVTGGAEMPPVGAQLSDRDIAAIATFVRNSWGSQYGWVGEDQVAAARAPPAAVSGN